MKKESIIADIKHWLAHYIQNIHSTMLEIYTIALESPTEYKEIEQEIPIGTLELGVTNICNAKCIFCVYKKVKERKGTMAFETFKKAVDEYEELGGKEISFTPVIGEALLDSGLLEKIAYAKQKKGIKTIAFYTNGTLLLRNNLYKGLVDSGLSEIKISMSGTSPCEYLRVYGTYNYSTLMNGLTALLKYNKKRGEPIRISIQFRTDNKPSKTLESIEFNTKIKPYLSKKVTYHFLPHFDSWAGEISEKDLTGNMKLRRKPKKQQFPCTRMFECTAILFDGSVRACNCRIMKTQFDDLVIGNIMQTPLKELYRKRMPSLRETFSKGELKKACQGCELYTPATKRWLEKIKPEILDKVEGSV